MHCRSSAPAGPTWWLHSPPLGYCSTSLAREARATTKKNGDPIVRLLICAGGTGGGVYPALAAYQALRASGHGVETLWVGGEGGMEAELVKREAIPFTTIPAAGLH